MKRFSFCDNIIKYHLLNVIGSNLLNDEGVADLCFAVLSNQSVTCNKQESFKTFFFYVNQFDHNCKCPAVKNI